MLITALSQIKTSETKCEANCAEAVKLAVRKVGLDDSVFSVSCTQTQRNLWGAPEWYPINPQTEQVQRNDIILFDWDCSGDCDHIGIIRTSGGGIIYYDDFNAGNAYRSHGTFRQISDKSMSIASVWRLKNKTETQRKVNMHYIDRLVEVNRGDKGGIVKLIQAVVGVKTDGMFGEDTLNAVKKFQEVNKCDVDGIVGDETFTCMSKIIERMK